MASDFTRLGPAMLLSLFLFSFLTRFVSPGPTFRGRTSQRDIPGLSLGSFPDGLVTGSLGALQGALGKTASYDYVIVGGGTGGVAMGVRLAESGANVAIIEAGNYYEIGEPVFANAPGGDVVFVGSSPLDQDPLVDWGFVAENQEGANNRPIHFARGKCLGGR